MKKCWLAILMSLLFFGNLLAATPINKIIAIVNDTVITQSQFDRKVQLIKKQMQRSGEELPSDAALRKQVLNQMIDEELELQIANQTGIRVSNDELNAQLESIAKQNKATLNELYQSVQKDGWTIDGFRQEVRDELIVHKLQERDVASRISITEQEVNDFLTIALNKSTSMPEYHLQSIFIALPATPSPGQNAKIQAQANQVVKQLRQGADFNEMAANYSNGGSVLKGGDIGWKKLAALPPAVADKVKNMTKNSVSDPIQTVNGFYIVKLLGERESVLPDTMTETEADMIYLKSNTANAVNQLNDLREQIISGKDFKVLAKKYSQDTKSAKMGGYVGWIQPGKYPASVDAAITQMNVGDVSQPIATQDGYYLIKVISKRRVSKSTASQRNQVEQLIFQRKLNEDLQTFINDLRSNAYIKIYN